MPTEDANEAMQALANETGLDLSDEAIASASALAPDEAASSFALRASEDRPGGQDARGRASVRTRCQQGESPCVVVVTPRVAEGNCVAARRGGKQPEAKE